jgi:hypothetical protein
VGEPLKRTVLGYHNFYSRVVKMNTDATKLKEYMSELSERAYCAGWEEGLEYALWKAVLNGRLKYGRLQITRAHTTKLKELSDKCGGWIVWNEVSGEMFLPLDRWQQMYVRKTLP